MTNTYMAKIITTVGKYVSLVIFGIGLFTAYNYIDTEFPFAWKVVTTTVFTVGAIWYFWEVIVKNFIAGYRDRFSSASPDKNISEKG